MQFHSDYNYFVRYIPGVGWNPHSKNTLISNSYSGSSKRIGEKSSGSRLTVPGAWWWNQEKELASLAGLVIVVEYLFFTGNRYSFVLLNIFDLDFHVGNADYRTHTYANDTIWQNKTSYLWIIYWHQNVENELVLLRLSL